ncbi:ABC transporter permease [Luteipulveratus sp. YIM 133132]|uniref:ABC transporter permease n=1 Tax=Luteipulveratus flavus TaxID=3031728 RepID=A0ABT6C5S3_9MICO|nr:MULTISPECIES: ABC transporter permease [unclassified Luteipulveratus]MDE9365406.1 ABC transporter permease [Luteipulveratus sp. YIM 133132]MDF8263908.1 ABC transporter permease [Luteipulveratus sp. YIM 133296]
MSAPTPASSPATDPESGSTPRPDADPVDGATPAPTEPAEPTGPASSPQVRQQLFASLLQRQGAAAALILVLAISWVTLPRFGSTENMRDIALQSSFLAIIALGMTFVIITGGIDLSVGSVYALGGVLAAYGAQSGVLMALLLPLAVCGAIGLVNGLLVARLGLPPFIVTLASLLFARGLLLAITSEGSKTRTISDSSFLSLGRDSFLGLGLPVWFAIVLCLIGGLVLRRTRFGESVFATGGAEQSALLMGLPVVRVKVTVYALSGLLAGFAGALTAAYLQSGVTVIGVGVELDAIAAVVIGGTLLSGGAGTVLGTVVGVLLRNVISNVINQIGGLDSNYQSVISGAFLLLVVVVQRLLSQARPRRRR